jgi:hypothetical protein
MKTVSKHAKYPRHPETTAGETPQRFAREQLQLYYRIEQRKRR